jgi:hypothetical protein
MAVFGENIHRVNVENEGTVLAQVSDFNYLLNVFSETEKGVELNQTCNTVNGAVRYILATGDCKRALSA